MARRPEPNRRRDRGAAEKAMKAQLIILKNKSPRRALYAAVGAISVVLVAVPADAKPITSQRGSAAITYSSRHLPQRDQPEPGREMGRGPIPEPVQRELVRPYAEIPDPSPNRRALAGGTSVRRGRYFYRVPPPVTLASPSEARRRQRVSIPSPVVDRRRFFSSQATR